MVFNDISETKMSLKTIMNSPVITINSQETIGKSVDMMWKNGISQLPVIEDGKVIGSIREETILNKFNEDNVKDILKKSVISLIEAPFPAVSIDTNPDDVLRLLSLGATAVLVNDHQRMVGIITKIDLIAKHMM
jgi:predicted transcriptional regulator